MIPLSAATFYTRPDVVPVLVQDIALNHVCLAWTASRRSRIIHDFAEIAAGITWT